MKEALTRLTALESVNGVETEDTSETDYLIFGYEDVARLHGIDRAEELQRQFGGIEHESTHG